MAKEKKFMALTSGGCARNDTVKNYLKKFLTVGMFNLIYSLFVIII
jgi:hypothetical protein